VGGSPGELEFAVQPLEVGRTAVPLVEHLEGQRRAGPRDALCAIHRRRPATTDEAFDGEVVEPNDGFRHGFTLRLNRAVVAGRGAE
jgi:hypothetical protein